MTGLIKFLFDWIVTPGLAWSMCLYGALDWISRKHQDVPRSLLGGVFLLLIVSAYAYQTGYKGFYRSGRKNYFYGVFIAPIAVGVIGLLVGVVSM